MTNYLQSNIFGMYTKYLKIYGNFPKKFTFCVFRIQRKFIFKGPSTFLFSKLAIILLCIFSMCWISVNSSFFSPKIYWKLENKNWLQKYSKPSRWRWQIKICKLWKKKKPKFQSCTGSITLILQHLRSNMPFL
jgi:hypothetical protein